MTIIAFIIEYTGINKELFDSSYYDIKYPFGRVIECVPYASFGILYFWHFKDRKKMIKIILLVLSVVITAFSWFLIPKPLGYGYGGVYLLFSSTSICILALILPDKVYGHTRIIINFVGACTMGIFCLHMLIGWMLRLAILHFNILEKYLCYNTLIFDAIIFIICLVITIFIRSINNKLHWNWVTYIV